jgi:hypothetical protein
MRESCTRRSFPFPETTDRPSAEGRSSCPRSPRRKTSRLPGARVRAENKRLPCEGVWRARKASPSGAGAAARPASTSSRGPVGTALTRTGGPGTSGSCPMRSFGPRFAAATEPRSRTTVPRAAKASPRTGLVSARSASQVETERHVQTRSRQARRTCSHGLREAHHRAQLRVDREMKVLVKSRAPGKAVGVEAAAIDPSEAHAQRRSARSKKLAFSSRPQNGMTGGARGFQDENPAPWVLSRRR